MTLDYDDILQDVARFSYTYREGFWDGMVEHSGLSPAAEEALDELSMWVTADLGVPRSVARQGLLYALHMVPHPLGSSLIHLAYTTREGRQAVGDSSPHESTARA